MASFHMWRLLDDLSCLLSAALIFLHFLGQIILWILVSLQLPRSLWAEKTIFTARKKVRANSIKYRYSRCTKNLCSNCFTFSVTWSTVTIQHREGDSSRLSPVYNFLSFNFSGTNTPRLDVLLPIGTPLFGRNFK